jgi:hypothetical protein
MNSMRVLCSLFLRGSSTLLSQCVREYVKLVASVRSFGFSLAPAAGVATVFVYKTNDFVITEEQA